MSRLSDWVAELRNIGNQDEDWDDPSQFLAHDPVDQDVDEELDDRPSRHIEGWDQGSQAVSLGRPRCPHPGCIETITFTQNAAGRNVACCGVHGVVQPIPDKVRPDYGRQWGDGCRIARWQPDPWWVPTRRRTPPMSTMFVGGVVRAKKPAPKPRYEVPLDPLDYGNR
jgi:hypothetical protein